MRSPCLTKILKARLNGGFRKIVTRRKSKFIEKVSCKLKIEKSSLRPQMHSFFILQLSIFTSLATIRSVRIIEISSTFQAPSPPRLSCGIPLDLQKGC